MPNDATKSQASERSVKRDRVITYLDSHDLDAVLLGRRCNFAWYTCGAHNHVGVACDVGASWLLVSRDRAVVLANNIEAPRLEEELPDGEIEIVRFPYHDAAERDRVVADAFGSLRVVADAPGPFGVTASLGGDFDRLRWTLTPWELDRYRSLVRDAAECVESVAQTCRPGDSEWDLGGRLSAAVAGKDCLVWTLLVAADERIDQFRHPLPTRNRVRQRAMLVIGAERDGLIASCSRLVSLGRVSADLARRHRAATTVDTAMLSATRPGATLGEIFDEAVAAYEATGFADEWRLHHQGGSCGYLPRDVKAAPGEMTPVLADQAFAWNPSIAGTKSEDTVLCLASGVEIPAAGTDWPVVQADWKGRILARPDILCI
jgi:Xaa-Pro aminopeptidase